MATKTILIDDIDGTKADETITFVIQSNRYSLDLSAKNAKRFWDALQPFIDAAKNLDGDHQQAVEAQTAAVEQRQAIREWARKKGYDISDRGRISTTVEDAYRKAHKQG